jgi:hypothetical protein
MSAVSDMFAVAGWSGYFVTKAGEVYSTRRSDRLRTKEGEVHRLRPQALSNGYLAVRLCRKEPAGIRHLSVCIHAIVAEAFLGPKPEWHQEIRHRDGNRHNNQADNLLWGTVSDNQQDSIAHGTKPLGDAHVTSKLRAVQVADIKQRLRLGEAIRTIAEEYGVHRAAIHAIKNGKSWKHVTENREAK